MSQPSHSTRFTYEDYVLFPDDGKRHELIEGEHYVTPSPTTRHQRVLGDIFASLRRYLQTRPIGVVYFAPCDVVLSEQDVVQPDLLYISEARAHIVTDKNIQGAPDLVVEIVSESSRRLDELTKRKFYERFGVEEYWIVDPELDTMKIYTRSGDAFERARELSKETGDTLESALFPGLSLALAELFR